ncbi:MAG: hypothetical protein PUE08_03770 [Eubacteriales bacterium]|nr:hypothetical protein [Eubacteriales bacterium]
MILYDKLINEILSLFPSDAKVFPYEKSSLGLADKNAILFAKDTAYELGGSQKSCVSTTVVSSDMTFDNSVYLYGKDIPQIKEDCLFCKIVLLEIEDIDEETAFDKIKELEFVRYSTCPEGFMTRASALSMREQIRVSKKAVKDKVSFKDYGNLLIEKYLSFPIVKSVRIIFATEFDDFDKLYLLCDKVKSTTSALNHILDNVLFDCSSCNLKEICDEVEGMKELHMKKAKER